VEEKGRGEEGKRKRWREKGDKYRKEEKKQKKNTLLNEEKAKKKRKE
jgi:hypothetical protein